MESNKGSSILFHISVTSTHIYADYLYLKYPAEFAEVESGPEWNLII